MYLPHDYTNDALENAHLPRISYVFLLRDYIYINVHTCFSWETIFTALSSMSAYLYKS